MHTRTCGARRCRDVVTYRNSRSNPAAIEADRLRCEAWLTKNGGYLLARLSLKKRGLLTPEIEAKLSTLKGQGKLSTHEALERAGLAHLIPSKQTHAGAAAAATAATVDTEPATNAEAWRLASPQYDKPLAYAAELRLLRKGENRSSSVGFVEAVRLHGALHSEMGLAHNRVFRDWTLFLPTPSDRRLWMIARDRSLFEQLPQHIVLAAPSRRLDFDKSMFAAHEIKLGLRATLRPPRAREAGQYRVRVQTITPIVMRRDKYVTKLGRRVRELYDRIERLVGPLAYVARWLGLDVPEQHIIATVIAQDVERVIDRDGRDGIRVGGHWMDGEKRGRIVGLVGWLDIECNAVGRWLLDCAALVGLGARTTIGFGRVRVEDR
jgi:hypothetical protein